MTAKHNITNQDLYARFENPFVLANFAIKLVHQQMGRPDWHDDNPVNRVLAYLHADKEIPPVAPPEAKEEAAPVHE